MKLRIQFLRVYSRCAILPGQRKNYRNLKQKSETRCLHKHDKKIPRPEINSASARRDSYNLVESAGYYVLTVGPRARVTETETSYLRQFSCPADACGVNAKISLKTGFRNISLAWFPFIRANSRQSRITTISCSLDW